MKPDPEELHAWNRRQQDSHRRYYEHLDPRAPGAPTGGRFTPTTQQQSTQVQRLTERLLEAESDLEHANASLERAQWRIRNLQQDLRRAQIVIEQLRMEVEAR